MEEISDNVELEELADPKRSRNQTGPRSSQRSFHSVLLCLGLLSVFLLAGRIVLGVVYRDSAADLSSIREILTERLQTSNDELSSMTAERDRLNASLTEMTKERDRLQKETCPAEWKMFRCSCYFLSRKRDSWKKAREDCRSRGADLVVINSPEEQTFLSTLMWIHTWIGLNDTQIEGTWMWVDGTPLTLSYWEPGEPNDSGDGEDCVQIKYDEIASWNDIPCGWAMPWICEKQP